MGVKENIRKIIDSDDDLTVRNVSLKAGMSDSALHKFLNNEAQSISIKNLMEVAKVLDVDVRQLFADDEPEPSRPLFNEDQIATMVRNAMLEIQPGMTLGEIEPVVASALHEQIERLQSDGVAADRRGSGHAPDRAAQSDAPTKVSGRAVSRTK